MKRLLVTGGAGFIGSHFVRHMLHGGGELEVLVNLDLLTYAGNQDNLVDIMGDARYVFVRGDIGDAALLEELFRRWDFDAVANFAAESHVDRSISDPARFITTNVLGAQTLLEQARRHWRGERGRFLQVSTDEVYGALGETGKFTEETPLAPNNPYSAAKAGADLMARAYHRTYGFPVVISRSSNNYGPNQFPEKLIPRMVLTALEGGPLPIYGDGLQVRDWLHVEDNCTALAAILAWGEPGQVYNIGSGAERTNLALVRLILDELGRPESLITHVADRPGHDRRYAMDAAKLTRTLCWMPARTFEEGLRAAVRWYVEHPDWVARVRSGEYRN